MALVAELKRRKVFQVGAAYLVVGWLLIQAASIALPAFQAPDWALRTFILLVALGFPLALVLAWAIDLTPEGLKVDEFGVGTKRLFTLAAILAALAVGWFVRGLGVEAPGETTAQARSIAVLPFANLSSDPEQEYFSDGLSEEMLNLLSRVPDLQVIARTSSFSFKGKDADVRSIGLALGVAHVLEGSVRRSGDRMRVAVRLVRAADSAQIWAETFDRQLTDVFVVQDEIARSVVRALEIRLTPGQLADAVANSGTSNSEAYNQYLLGRQFFARSGPANYARAVNAFERAVALDPGFAAAHVGLGLAISYSSESSGDAATAGAADTRAAAAIERAIALDPGLAAAYAARGLIRQINDWAWDLALADFERALALDPDDAESHRRHATLLGRLGRYPEAEAAARRAIRLDPLSAAAHNMLGTLLRDSGRLPEARIAMLRALEIDPEYDFAHYGLGIVALLEGKAGEAKLHFERSRESFALAGTAKAEYTLGDARASQQALDQLIERYPGTAAFQIACVYAWRGEPDLAFEWLERALIQRDGGMPNLKVHPDLRTLRDDPRFHALLRRMNLSG